MNVKLILTGSASFELKSKLKESLAGRKMVFNIMPFTFFEFLKFKDNFLFDVLKKKNKFVKASTNRLNSILAIIFLIVGLIIYQLIKLQVYQYDYYTAIASGQHQTYNKIAPERGKIFMKDKLTNGDTKLYPLATNKDFALIYAVPKKIKDPVDTANKLYDLFDKEDVEKEIEEMLNDSDFFKQDDESIEVDEKKEEFRKVKKELELEIRKKRHIVIPKKKNKMP